MADDSLPESDERTYVQVLDGEFGLVAIWGPELTARLPAIGGVPAEFSADGVVWDFLALKFPDLSRLEIEGQIYKLDERSRTALADGKVFASDRDGARMAQLFRPGKGETQLVRLEDFDTSAIDAAVAEFDDQAAEVNAAVALLVEQFNEQLRNAQEEIAGLHEKLDSIVRHQLVTEWAWLEVDFVELVDMIALIRAGEPLSGADHAALREAVRHAHLSVLRARGELTELFDLVATGTPDLRHREQLRSHLANPMSRYWLQSYARGQVQLMLARSLLLYGHSEPGPVRNGQLRQRLLDQSRAWTADADALSQYARSPLDIAAQGRLRRRKAKQLNNLLAELNEETDVVAAPLSRTWAGLPASVGVELPLQAP